MEGEDEGRDGRPFSTASTSVSLVSICEGCGQTDGQTITSSATRCQRLSSSLSESQRYLVVVGAEVLEVAEADVGQTHHDGDDQHHQGEQRGRRLEPCSRKRLALLALASHLQGVQLLSPSDVHRSCSSALSAFSSSSSCASKRSRCA